jgi:hypothetical protein
MEVMRAPSGRQVGHRFSMSSEPGLTPTYPISVPAYRDCYEFRCRAFRAPMEVDPLWNDDDWGAAPDTAIT